MNCDQRGQVTVLVIGLMIVVLSVAGIAIDGTRAFMLRRSLQNAADGAALAAASELDRARFYESGGKDITLDPEAVRDMAGRLLEPRGLPAQVLIEQTSDEVSIVLRADAPATFLRLVGVSEIPVDARAVAVPVEGEP